MILILHASEDATTKVVRLEATQNIFLVAYMLNMLLASDVCFLEALESDLFPRHLVDSMLHDAKAALAYRTVHIKVINAVLARFLIESGN